MKKEKKIVHLSTVHHPCDPRIYHKQCKTLLAAGFDVTLLIPEPKETILFAGGVKMVFLPRPKSRLQRIFCTGLQMFRLAQSLKSDVYHFHDPELIPVAFLLKKKNNIVIYDVHEDYATGILQKHYLPRPIRSLSAYIFSCFERLLTRSFSICLAEKYYQEKFPSGRQILNYPWFNQNLMTGTTPLKGMPLLYTGNVTQERGAFLHARLPLLDSEIHVTIMGYCPRETAREMYRLAGKSKERLKIIGIDTYIPRDDIDKQYQQGSWLAGLVLLPPSEHYRRKELTKFFEYMNARLPILCSNFPAWKEFVDKYDCGIAVDPHNDAEIINALKYLKNNPGRAREMGENGRRIVREELNWQKEGEKLIQWYNHLLQGVK